MKQRKPNKRKQAQAARRKAEKAKAPRRWVNDRMDPMMSIGMAMAAMQMFGGRRHD